MESPASASRIPGMREAAPKSRNDLAGAIWKGLRQDSVARLAAAGFVLYILWIFIVGLPSRPFRYLVTFVFVSLAVIAIRKTRLRAIAAEEIGFWSDLQRGTLCWLGVPVLYVIFSAFAYGSLWLGWMGDALYLLFYVNLYLALAVRPHRQDRWRAVGLERRLTWPTVSLAVIGLFLYFLVPKLVGNESYDRGLAATSLFLVLDCYFALRLFIFQRTVRRPAWRAVYLFLALTPGLVFVNDVLGALSHALDQIPSWYWSVVDIGWKLPPIFMILAARVRHFELPPDPPQNTRALAQAFPGPLGQTMIFAVIFPLIHFGGSVLGWLDTASHPIRGGLVMVWLLMLGTVAFAQYGLLAKSMRRVADERNKTERALRRVEDEISLNRRLQAKVEEQRASDQIFTRAFQASPDVMAILRASDLQVLEINESARTVLGHPPHEAVGKTLEELLFWVRPTDEEKIMEDLRESSRTENRNIVFRRGSGELRLGLFAARRFDLDDVPCLLVVVCDVTDQARSRQRLEQRQALLNDAAGAIVAWNTDERLTFWNPAAENLFALDAEEVVGRPLDELPKSILDSLQTNGALAIPAANQGTFIVTAAAGVTVGDEG